MCLIGVDDPKNQKNFKKFIKKRRILLKRKRETEKPFPFYKRKIT